MKVVKVLLGKARADGTLNGILQCQLENFATAAAPSAVAKKGEVRFSDVRRNCSFIKFYSPISKSCKLKSLLLIKI